MGNRASSQAVCVPPCKVVGGQREGRGFLSYKGDITLVWPVRIVFVSANAYWDQIASGSWEAISDP